MRQVITIAVALAAGFLGGILGSRVAPSNEAKLQEVVRARAFELVDGRGEIISLWGVDDGDNVVLAFGSRGLAPGRARHGVGALALSDPNNQLLALGLLGEDSPMVKMRGSDGRSRLRMFLSTAGKPSLTMNDENGPRLSLGVEQSDTPGPEDNDWSLVFAQDRARIGMITEKRSDGKYVRGVLGVSREYIKYPDYLRK